MIPAHLQDFLLDCEAESTLPTPSFPGPGTGHSLSSFTAPSSSSSSSAIGYSNNNRTGTESSNMETVANVLLYGLEVLVPLLSSDLLRSFPTTADRC